jgi:DNA-binding LacI/PurR family transcriptional regulator
MPLDGFPWAVAFVPSLIIVRQPIERMAHDALALLTKRMESGTTETAVVGISRCRAHRARVMRTTTCGKLKVFCDPSGFWSL